MKKLVSALIAAAIAAGGVTAFAAFGDVSETDAAYSAINELELLKIVDGDENGNFNPKKKLTRAEFVKLVIAALGENDAVQAVTAASFKDCEGHWAAGYIEAGAADGFISGYNDDEFGPDDPVTYAQVLKILVSCIGYAVYGENQGGYPSGYINYANALGITKNISGAKSDSAVTRELAAVLIDNTIKIPLMVYEWNTGRIDGGTLLKLDGTGGKDYETLLTDRHDAYIVKGRVTETRGINRSLKKDQVTYQVEVSDNFDGRAYNKTAEPFAMNVGNTNAAEYLFYYTEVLVQKENDSYTILNIKEK